MAKPMKLDVLIRNGMVYDGVSDAGRVADVGVLDGRIVLPASPGREPKASAAFGPQAEATRVIDATGKAVLPGFIDAHSHSDFAWLIWPNATSKLLSGVTTDVSGNCGSGAFPLSGEVLARRQAAHARHNLNIDWRDAAGYFDRLESTPCSLNRAVLVGHGNCRGVTVGYSNRRADRGELARMRQWVARGMDAGAFGLSSGLIYPPGCFAEPAELTELVEVARDRGGFYSSHIRNEGNDLLDAVDEFIGVLETTRCRGLLSHLKTWGRANWPKIGPLRERLTRARERGVALWADRYPYTAACTSLEAMVLPRWAIEGTTRQVLARLTNPSDRRRIAGDLSAREAGSDGRFFDNIRVTSFGRPGFEQFVGKSLTEIGQLRGQDPFDAAVGLLVEDELQPEAVHFAMSEENLAEILSWPFVMIGSDAGVRDALSPGDMCHPRAFGTPAAFLAAFVRDRQICDWPTAARKLATMAAEMLGLADRGRIAAGCWADLVVLDPESIADGATYPQPRRPPTGIEFVLVNGDIAVAQGRFTGAMNGQVLRHR